MKKLLMLGGSHSQIPAIKAAREMGHFIILCDYLEDNPGKEYAHEYYNISTMDKEAVLSLAKLLEIDGIVCYVLDATASTAAYVAEKLGLSSHPYESVEIISNKDMFRAFLKKNNFNVPKNRGYYSVEEAKADFHNYKMPVMVKPVDSSGSRGVFKIDSIKLLQEKVESALSFSRAKRFIIEEYIEKYGYQVEGDGFSVNGELVFRCFANGHFLATSLNPFVPIGESWPCNMPERLQNKIHNEIQKVLNLLNMKTGAFNFDIQIDDKENIYILDMGARNGGNLIPQVIKYATDIDMIDYTIKAALNEDCSDLSMVEPKGYWSSYAILSHESGIYKGIEIEDEFQKNNIVEYELTVKENDTISVCTGLNEKLGTMILKFTSMEEMLEKMDNMTNWVKIIVEDSLVKNS